MKNPLQLVTGMHHAHRNQYLFSDHYLNSLLPRDPRWEAALPEAKATLSWLQKLYAREQDQLPEYNESQLKHHWFKPILEQLGHVYEGQASAPGLEERVKRPDFVFFPNDRARQGAMKAQKTADYAARALAVGEVKAWDIPLGKKEKGAAFEAQNPSWQIDYYVRATGLAWGILSNGRRWRLVHEDSSQRLSIYYEIDLVELLKRGKADELRYFTLFFHQAAFLADAQERVFLDDALKASSEYALELEEDLKENAYQALERLIQGFLDLPANELGERNLREIYDNSLYLLYRLLFILYAESRGLLPLENDQYREQYSMRDIQGDVARGDAPTAPTSTVLWNRIQTLFHIINGDDSELNRYLGVPRYNGGLFTPGLHPFLEEKAIGDQALTGVVDLLCRRTTEAGRESVDYRTLGVRHLGSIYEGLLEYQPRYAREPMVAVRDRKGERWVAEGSPGERPLGSRKTPRVRIAARREAGQVYLETGRGERKATGSYYTPQYIVEYIVSNTLGPLVEEAVERVRARAKAAKGKVARAAEEQSLANEILDLKVLDPAMGSGHFLVEATEFLALELATDPYVETGTTPEDDLSYWRRRVVERCIYGVDKNPLAVELAKLSLWLATVAADKPLSFLDHHLRCGDSLIGARVADLGWAPPVVLKKKARKEVEQQKAGQVNMFDYLLSRQLPAVMSGILEITEVESDSYDTVEAKEAADQAVRELKAPFEAVADLWVSAYFGSEVTRADYEEALALVGRPQELLSLLSVQWAHQMAQERRFFHWELAFPEAFYDRHGQPLRDRAGFDAVVGNPPYVSAWSMTGTDADIRSCVVALTPSRNVLGAHWDLYIPFLLKAYHVTRRAGMFSFIIPNPFCREKYATGARRFLLERTCLKHVLSFGEENVFEEVSRQTLVPVFRKESPDWSCATVRVDDALSLMPTTVAQSGKKHRDIAQKTFYKLPGHQIRHEANPAVFEVLDRIDTLSLRLGNLCYVNYGAQVSSREKGAFGKAKLVSHSPRENAKRFFEGRDISRYDVGWGGLYLSYEPDIMYGPRAPELFESPKLVVRKISGEHDSLVTALDQQGMYCDDGLVLAVPYDAVANTNLRKEFEGYSRLDDPYGLKYVLAVVASRLESSYYALRFATGSLQGSYSHVYPQHVRQLPIRRIEFTTPPDERAWLEKKGRQLYEGYVHQGDEKPVISFVEHQLRQEPEHSDVVHDLLAYLAERMIAMNKEKQATADAFWLDLEGVTDAGVFETLRKKGKQEATLWKGAEACRPFVSEESHSTRRLDESLGWNEEAFTAFVKALVRKVADLSDLVEVYRKYHPGYRALVARIEATDRLIDQVVYKLYGLTQEEVAIVEGR